MTACYDVVVAGAGPAGIAAATVAAECGRRVCLLDDNPAAGGQIWRGIDADDAAREAHGKAFAHWSRRLRAAGVTVQSGARVVARPAKNVLRVESANGWTDIGFQKLILATGARERYLPFPGWTLPGVMGAGGLQALVKAGLPVEGKRVVLAGSGPLLLAVAAVLARRGARVVGIFEQAPLARMLRFGASMLFEPGKLMEGARYRAVTHATPYRTSSWVVRAHGRGRLEAVTLSTGGWRREMACDYLGCGFHLVPNLELPRLLGCRIEEQYVCVDSAQQTSLPEVYCAGELTGVGGLDKALVEGETAGLAAAGRSSAGLAGKRDRLMRFARNLDAAFALRDELRGLAEAETLICRCEDVPRAALVEFGSWREAKLHTRCGMGPCQGRVCGPAANFLFGWENESVRPPLTPARIGTLAEALEEHTGASL